MKRDPIMIVKNNDEVIKCIMPCIQGNTRKDTYNFITERASVFPIKLRTLDAQLI